MAIVELGADGVLSFRLFPLESTGATAAAAQLLSQVLAVPAQSELVHVAFLMGLHVFVRVAALVRRLLCALTQLSA